MHPRLFVFSAMLFGVVPAIAQSPPPPVPAGNPAPVPAVAEDPVANAR
jgi:hypothetical protein